MKVSYKVLKKYIPDIKSPEDVAQDLIMHTAEVEEIHETGKHLQHVFTWKIISHAKHPDADKLNICQVEVCWETKQIICGAPNVRDTLIVAVALPGAELKADFTIQKSKIRGETSNGMLCSEDELGLTDERQEWIMELPEGTELWVCMREYLWFDDIILEVDNKAINHRPDLFSHIGIAREIAAIAGNTLGYTYSEGDFSGYPDGWVDVQIPEVVKRYMWVTVSQVQNSKTPEHIRELIASHEIDSKGILVDITNYCLYLYGQPTHCFDADKLTGNIHVRYALEWETFEALNAKSYELTPSDIVIADDSWVIALGGIIGGQKTAVSDSTTNIIIESAWFEQSIIRATGKRIGLRTDALNVFEKDLTTQMQARWVALILSELRNIFPNLKIEKVSDVYPDPRTPITIELDVQRINNLIGAEYAEERVITLLSRLGITHNAGILTVPFWRKDLNHIADIAEEVTRLDGYNNVDATVPRINLGAISQSPLYRAKRDTRNYLTAQGFFEMYTYSFVDETLMKRALWNTENLVPLKNALTEEMTHMRGSLIPNLLQALQDNSRDFQDMQLFEFEKVFSRIEETKTSEHYELSLLQQSSWENAYYDMQTVLKDLFTKLWILKYGFKTSTQSPSFAHSGRTADIIVRGKSVGCVGEIHPKVLKNFELIGRAWFVTLNMDALLPSLYSLIQATEISNFQENSFDINFVVDKATDWDKIVSAIAKADALIQKVELFDIYESDEKLPGERSLSFTVYTQSMTETLDDTYKNTLIENIVKRVEKVWGRLR